MAKQERGARSRQQILEAAASVFEQRGYDAASTTEILSRTDLTRGSLYHHFPSKEAIATALMSVHEDALVMPEHPVAVQAVIDLTLGFAERLQKDQVLRAAVRLATEHTSLSHGRAAPYEQSRTAVYHLLRRAEQQGELLPGIDLEAAAWTIVGSFTGLQIMSQVYSGRRDLLQGVNAFWQFILPGLAAPWLLLRLRTTPAPGEPDADS
ncbi:ScbR family autoregulator-binding transcription factor [Actinacidiphila glaucinigra]|uniref:ScbR family autoregulator-binding transcription factor n=1 Tax=Actinacidiphila glaucinigra TaxID=235986 RepID=UPI002E32E657|nr:ScbR family autoregulator-binding transcription factor [Actinacidiphila glaucinigra]